MPTLQTYSILFTIRRKGHKLFYDTWVGSAPSKLEAKIKANQYAYRKYKLSIHSYKKIIKKNPGAAWHKEQMEQANDHASIYRKEDKRRYFYGGRSSAHRDSFDKARKLGMNPAAKAYVGITHRAKPHLFTSSVRPSQVHLGAKYLKVYGPFKSYTEAEQFEDRLRTKHRMNPKVKLTNKELKALESYYGYKLFITDNVLSTEKYKGGPLESIMSITEAKSFAKRIMKVKKNPELGKMTDKELLAIDMANKFGAKKIREGISWMKAVFNTQMSSTKFCQWLDKNNYDYWANHKKATNDYIVSFRSLKKNPPQATEIYSDVLAIEAKKGKDSLWPGEKFRHSFKKGGKIIGLNDGSLLIKPKKNGQKLWKNFNY